MEANFTSRFVEESQCVYAEISFLNQRLLAIDGYCKHTVGQLADIHVLVASLDKASTQFEAEHLYKECWLKLNQAYLDAHRIVIIAYKDKIDGLLEKMRPKCIKEVISDHDKYEEKISAYTNKQAERTLNFIKPFCPDKNDLKKFRTEEILIANRYTLIENSILHIRKANTLEDRRQTWLKAAGFIVVVTVLCTILKLFYVDPAQGSPANQVQPENTAMPPSNIIIKPKSTYLPVK